MSMRYINWLLRALLFIALLGFAVKNDQPVTLRYFFGYEWQTLLVVALLLFFVVGAISGVLAMLVTVLRQRREIARLKRDAITRNALDRIVEEHQTPIQPS
jgi:uncharacterized integral membrane protein